MPCTLTHNGWKRISASLPHKSKFYSTSSVSNSFISTIHHTDDKPELNELYYLTSGCTKVKVIKTIAPKWIELAMVMGYEHSDIESVDKRTQKDPLNAVRVILGQWLDGAEDLCGPPTWSTLVEHISTIECQSLADTLNSLLLD